eukprot:gene22561-27233_t
MSMPSITITAMHASLLINFWAPQLLVHGATIELEIRFSESSLEDSFFTSEEDRVFGVNWYTCQSEIRSAACPGGQATWRPEYWVTSKDRIVNDTWKKVIQTGPEYTGPVSLDLFAPMPLVFSPEGVPSFTSSVTWCYNKPEDQEMAGEICPQNGVPWTVQITSVKETVTLTAYPGFGLAHGKTSNLLPALYSPQLNNTRDVAVYVPPTLLQNKVRRPVNVMVLLDASLSVVESFASRAGFESAQLTGVAPESIMIGITAIEFARAGDFDQRTFELTYAPIKQGGSCIIGARSGGCDFLLDWIDHTVIPAALMKIGDTGMTRGEIAKNYQETGRRPKTVIQYLGAEVYNQSQLEYLMRDETAWKQIGMQQMEFGM